MQLKTKIPNFLPPEPDRNAPNCISIEDELIQNMHQIYQQQREEGGSRTGATPPHLLVDPEDCLDFLPFNRTPDVHSICVELKLKLDVRNANGEADLNSEIYLNINPRGVMSRNQRSIAYQYRSTEPVRDEGLRQLTREQRMKYFTTLSHQLAGRAVTFQGTTYKLLNVLQTAIYGGVYLAQVVQSEHDGPAHKKKAIKILSKNLIELAKDKVQEDPLSEYRYRSCMSGHSNILSCDCIFDDDYYVYMIMPFAVHGDLFEVMKRRRRPFTEEEAKYLFYQILLSVKFLHCRKLALRDISLENVLLFENEQNGLIYPVLNDPGQATYFSLDKRNEVSLLECSKIFGKIFRPPEVYERCKYDPTKVDVFCVGYILYFCLTKQELFRCTLAKDMHWNLLKSRRYHELLRDKKGLHLSEPALDFIFRCLEPDFKRRLEVGEALRHPWFRGNFFPVHNQSLFHLQGGDAPTGEVTTGEVTTGEVTTKEVTTGEVPTKEDTKGDSSAPIFKLSKEIERCAKRKNIAIGQNASIQFSIYEHVVVPPLPPAAPPQVYVGGDNSPSPCLSTTHRREYPPGCEPHVGGGLTMGEKPPHRFGPIGGKRPDDTPSWATADGGTPTWTDLNGTCKGVPPHVGGYPNVGGYLKVGGHPNVGGPPNVGDPPNEASPTSPTDYHLGKVATRAHYTFAKQPGVLRKSPPPAEKPEWAQQYGDSASTHMGLTPWRGADQQSSPHNSPPSCSAAREKSKWNFVSSPAKGAYRMIGMKRKKQKLSSVGGEAEAEAEVDRAIGRGDTPFVDSPSSGFHITARQSFQTGEQGDTRKAGQKNPHMLTTAAVAKGRGLLSIFSERQFPNGGGPPQSGRFAKQLAYPIGHFKEGSFIHVEEEQSDWGNICRKNTPLEWSRNLKGKGVTRWERGKDQLMIPPSGYQNGSLHIQQRDTDKRECIDEVAEMAVPHFETPWEVKLSEKWRDVHMGAFKKEEEEEENYSAEMEGVVSPMSGSPLHDVTIVTGGDTPQRTDRIDTTDSNGGTKSGVSYKPNGGNGKYYSHLNEEMLAERNAPPYGVAHLGEAFQRGEEEAPPSGLHNGGDLYRGVKRWCSLGGREVIWKDVSPKGVFTPCEGNFFSGESTPSVSESSYTDRHLHMGGSNEKVKGTPSDGELHNGELLPHRDESCAYTKEEAASPNSRSFPSSPRSSNARSFPNTPSHVDNRSDVATSHAESLKGCSPPNKREEQNQTDSNSFGRCSEAESRHMCSIVSRSASSSMGQGKGTTSDHLITTMSSCLSEDDLEVAMVNVERECPTPGGSKERTCTLQGGVAVCGEVCSEVSSEVMEDGLLSGGLLSGGLLSGGLLSGEPHDEEEDFKDALEYELEHELEREIREEERQLERELEVELQRGAEVKRGEEVETGVISGALSAVVSCVGSEGASSCASGGGELNREGAPASGKEKVRNVSGGTLEERYESLSGVESQPEWSPEWSTECPPEWQQTNGVKRHPNSTWSHSTSTEKGNQEIKEAYKNSLSGKKTQQVGELMVAEDTMNKRVGASGITTKRRSSPCKSQLRRKKPTNKMKKVYFGANQEKKKSKIVRLQKCVLGEGLRSGWGGPAKGIPTKGIAAKGITTKGITTNWIACSATPHRKVRGEPNDVGSIVNCAGRKGPPKTKAKVPCDRKKCLSKRHTISELRLGGGVNGGGIGGIGGNIGRSDHAKALPNLRAAKSSGKMYIGKPVGGKNTLLHLADTRTTGDALRDVGKRHTISNATIGGKSREGAQTPSVKPRCGEVYHPKGGVRGMQVQPAWRDTVGRVSLKGGPKASGAIRRSVRGSICGGEGGVLASQVATWNAKGGATKARRNHNQVQSSCAGERNQKELTKNRVEKEFKGKEEGTLVESHRGGESPTEEPTTVEGDNPLQGLNTTGLCANGGEAHVDHGLAGQDEVYMCLAAEREEGDLLNGDVTPVGGRDKLEEHSAGERVQGCCQEVPLNWLAVNEAPSQCGSGEGEEAPDRVKGRSTLTVEIPLGGDYAEGKSALRGGPHGVVLPRRLKINVKKRPGGAPTGGREAAVTKAGVTKAGVTKAAVTVAGGGSRISSDELVLNKFLAEMGGNPPARVPRRDGLKKGSSKGIQPDRANAHGGRGTAAMKQKSSLCRSVVGSQRESNEKEGPKGGPTGRPHERPTGKPTERPHARPTGTKQTRKNERRRMKDGVAQRGGAPFVGEREKCQNGVTPSRAELREGKNARAAQQGSGVYAGTEKKGSYLEKRKSYVFFFKRGLKGKLERMNREAEAEPHGGEVQGLSQEGAQVGAKNGCAKNGCAKNGCGKNGGGKNSGGKNSGGKRDDLKPANGKPPCGTPPCGSPTDAIKAKKTREGENPTEEQPTKLHNGAHPGGAKDVPPSEPKNLHGEMAACRCTPNSNAEGKEFYLHSGNNGPTNGSCHQSVSGNGVTPPRGNITTPSDERKEVHFSHFPWKNGRSSNSLGRHSMAVSWKDASNLYRSRNDGEKGHVDGASSPSNAPRGGVQTPGGLFTGGRKYLPIGGNTTQGYAARGSPQMGSARTAEEGELESLWRRTPAGDTHYADEMDIQGDDVKVHQRGTPPEGLMEREMVSTNRVAAISSHWDHRGDEGSPPGEWRPNGQLSQGTMPRRRIVGAPMGASPVRAGRSDANVAGKGPPAVNSRTHGKANQSSEEQYSPNEPTSFTHHQMGINRCSNGRTVDARGNTKQRRLPNAKERMQRLLQFNEDVHRRGEKNAPQVTPEVGSPSEWWSHVEQGTDTYLLKDQRKKKQNGNPCFNIKGDDMKNVSPSANHLAHVHASKGEPYMHIMQITQMSAVSPKNAAPGGISPTGKAAPMVPRNVGQKDEAHMARPLSNHNRFAVARGTNPNGPTLRAYQLPNTHQYGAQKVFIRCNERKVGYPMGDASGRRSQLEERKNEQKRANRNDAYAQALGGTPQGGPSKTYMSLHGTVAHEDPRQTKSNFTTGRSKKNSNLSILWWKA
ncbi:protein kinase domain-containing protein [Plasmodium vivax India VII]|uniref:Protein kinase domain-containing protein n=1 Tax=Plasmodium vivax India VII TaxID=1077284 RepID=A0A0J9SCJ5_PLAVI|nr:protein kinase domain-containing protein [Plasmodium vivax India VII]